MYSCHSILECCVTFSGVKLSIRSFVLFLEKISEKIISISSLFLAQTNFQKSYFKIDL